MELDDYILSHISPEPEQLAEIYRHTNLHHVYSHMCCGHLQGRLLKMLTSMIRPQRVLEIGAFTGYATLCFAEALPVGAEIHAVEIDDEKEDELLAAYARSPRAESIHLHIGDALRIVPTLGADWDIVLIDANKRDYVRYFEMVLPLVRPGGYIFADNTLWGGKVLADGADANTPTKTDACAYGKVDSQTRGILEFNDHVAQDPRVETVILPLRDGMTILRKLPTE